MRRFTFVVVGATLAMSVGVMGSTAGAGSPTADSGSPRDDSRRVDEPATAEQVLVDPLLDEATGRQVVSVRLTAAPVAENGSQRRVERQQDAMLDAVGADVEITEIARVDTVLNAVFLEIDAADIDTLAADPRVERISLVRDYELHLSDTVPHIGAAAVQLSGVDGTGVSVAVLDSGIDYTHVAFGGAGTIEAYEAAAGATASSPLASTRDGLFPTARVVGGMDFVGEAWNGSTVTVLSADDDPIDREGHGTHVADIIGGSAGVAPGVDLHAVKVCSAVASLCSGVAMLQGVEYATDPNGDDDTSDHVDIVNMSLGSSYGSQFDEDMSVAVDNATAIGVLSVASAGNSGDVSYIAGSPSTAATALSVAQTAMPVERMDQLTVTSPPAIAGSYDALRQWWSAPFTGVISAPLQYGDGAGNLEGCDEFAPGSLTGKVVLVDRGTCNASVKVSNVAAAGGLAALIGLVTDVPVFTFSLGEGDPNVPGFVITQATATALKAQIGSGVSVTLDPDDVVETDTAGRIASTSSRGPAIDNVSIKPEIGAPGASVSAEVGTGTGATPFGGTSGAAPVVAGVAALVLDAHPDRSPLELKATLMNAADPGVTEGDGVTPLPISRGGNGEVRAVEAVDAPAAAWSADTFSGSVSFGFVDVSDAATTLTRQVTVKNFTGAERVYTTAFDVRDLAEGASGVVSIDMPATVTVPASGTTTFDVTLTIDGTKLPAWTMNAETNGSAASRLTTHEIDGRISLTSGGHTARLAWHVLPRQAPAVSVVDSALVNDGVVSSNVEQFHLIGTSPDAPDAVAGAEAPQPDLRVLGYRVVGNPAGCASQGLGQLEFVVQTWDDTTFAGIPASVHMSIDVDQDGDIEGTLTDQRLTDVTQNAAFWFPTGASTGTATFRTEFVTNNDTRIMKICLGIVDPSLSMSTLRSIDVTPSIEDTWFAFEPTDTMPTSTIDLTGGRTLLNVGEISPPSVTLNPGATQPFTVFDDIESNSDARGLVLVQLLGGRAHEAIVLEAPGAVTALSATPGDGQVALTWSAPLADGGMPVTGYRVETSTGGDTWTEFETTTELSSMVTGLPNGTPHNVRVTAINAIGAGAPTSLNSMVTPRTVPGVPTSLAATPGNGQVALTWSAPASDGGSPIMGYRVESSTDGDMWIEAALSGTPGASVTGLVNGTAYRLRVTAFNEVGDSPAAVLDGTVTPRTVPGAPGAPAATPGDGRVDLSWAAPTSTGGAPVTGYRIQQSRNGGAWTTVVANTGSTTRTRRISGLANGTSYRFRVAAINVAGAGANSAVSAAVTPRTVPGAPTQLTATAGKKRISLAWRAPAANGGAAITGYRIQQKIGSGTWRTIVENTASTNRSRVIRNLDPAKTYRFRVAAINVAGTGANSAQTAGVKPN